MKEGGGGAIKTGGRAKAGRKTGRRAGRMEENIETILHPFLPSFFFQDAVERPSLSFLPSFRLFFLPSFHLSSIHGFISPSSSLPYSPLPPAGRQARVRVPTST